MRDRPLERVHEGTSEVRSYGDWFIKFPALAWYLDDVPPDLQAVVEHLAYRVYALFQIKVPASCLIHDGQQLGIATRKVSGPSLGSFLRSRGWDLEHVRQVPQAGDVYAGFYVDVLLANWDVVGLTGDNLILGPDGIYRIDPGGALTFRSQGGRKGEAFGDIPVELTTLKDPDRGTAGRVFQRMSAGEEVQAAAVFRAVSWPQLRTVVEEARREALACVQVLERRERTGLARIIGQEWAEIAPKLERRRAVLSALVFGKPDRS